MKLDKTQRIIVIALIVVAGYLILYIILKPFFSFENGMMNMMAFASQQNTVLNLLAIFLALLLGFIVTYLIKPAKQEAPQKSEIETIKKALSPDEKILVQEIQKAGEITQDSLRFRLNWSKAKVSAILTNMDRMGIIQRQRQGKTYKVFMQKNSSIPSNKQ